MEWRVEADKGGLRIRWREPSGKRCAKSLGLKDSRINRAEAAKVVALIELDYGASGDFDRTLKKYLSVQSSAIAESISALDLVKQYCAAATHLSKSQQSANRSALSWVRRLLPDCAAAISVGEAKQFRRQLEAEGLAGATIIKHLGVLSLAWDWGRECELIDCANPWREARQKIKVKAVRPADPFTVDEVERIIAGARKQSPA